MSTQYLCITPLSEPGDLGDLDDCGRVQVAFTVVAWKRPSSTFLEEIVGVLTAAEVGVLGESIFASSLAAIPRGDGPVLTVRTLSGASPVGTHNDGSAAYVMPTVQVIVRGISWQATYSMAQAAYAALVAVRNAALSA